MGYIYYLEDPFDGQVRYVGKTTLSLNKRLRYHTCKSACSDNTYRSRWILSLLNRDAKPIIKILEECDNSLLDDNEEFWICQLKFLGFKLTNHQSGGRGWTKGHKRRSMTEEEKRHLSKINKGRKAKKFTRQQIIDNALRQGAKPFTDGEEVFYTWKEAAIKYSLCRRTIGNYLKGITKGALNLKYMEFYDAPTSA